MVSTSGPLLLAFKILSVHYEIKVLLTLFQIFHNAMSIMSDGPTPSSGFSR